MKYLLVYILPLLIFANNPAAAEHYKIIANNDFPIDQLSKSNLRKFFLLKNQVLKGTQLLITNLKRDEPIRAHFSNDVLKKSSGKIERYYLKLALSGRGAVLKPFATEAEMIEKIKSSKGAIGYIAAETQVTGVKVLTIN